MPRKLINLIILFIFLLLPSLCFADMVRPSSSERIRLLKPEPEEDPDADIRVRKPGMIILSPEREDPAPEPEPEVEEPVEHCRSVDISDIDEGDFSCSGVDVFHIINSTELSDIQDYLNDYVNELHEGEQIYKFCFENRRDDLFSINETIAITSPACPKPIYINGLELNAAPGAPEDLTMITINEITNGLKIDQAVFQGNNAGTGIQINRSENVIIQGSRFANLDKGIQIENSEDVLIGVASPDMLDNQNTFENLELGINLISGNEVRYPINRYINVAQALQVDPSLDLIRPILLTNVYEEMPAAATDDVLKCKINEETEEMEYWVEVEGVNPEDKVILYRYEESEISGDMAIINKRYLSMCTIVDNKCYINFPDEMHLSMERCGTFNLRAEILVVGSLSRFSDYGRLYNKQGPTNIGSEFGGIDIAGPGATDSTTGSGDEFIDDDEDGGGESLATEEVDVASGSDLSGPSVGNAASSQMSCSMLPVNNSTKAPLALVLFVTLTMLVAVRLKGLLSGVTSKASQQPR